METSKLIAEGYQRLAFVIGYVARFDSGFTATEDLADEARVVFDVMQSTRMLREFQRDLEACAAEFPKPYGQPVEDARRDLTPPRL